MQRMHVQSCRDGDVNGRYLVSERGILVDTLKTRELRWQGTKVSVYSLVIGRGSALASNMGNRRLSVPLEPIS